MWTYTYLQWLQPFAKYMSYSIDIFDEIRNWKCFFFFISLLILLFLFRCFFCFVAVWRPLIILNEEWSTHSLHQTDIVFKRYFSCKYTRFNKPTQSLNHLWHCWWSLLFFCFFAVFFFSTLLLLVMRIF